MKDGIKLIYLHEDAGRITDTGVYLAPGAENVVTVGIHLNGELADAFVERGICAAYESAAEETVDEKPDDKPAAEEKPEMPWLDPVGNQAQK